MQQKIIRLFMLFLALQFANTGLARDLAKPEIMLANSYHQGVNLGEYWVSEKLDGVRAYWNGRQLVSRGGNIYRAPDWFIGNFPKQKLDGELWIARQAFERVVSTVRDKKPDDTAWKEVKFMVFDLPGLKTPFNHRLTRLQEIVKEAQIPWLQALKQWRVKDHQSLMVQLKSHADAGAEGLMLHRGASFYKGKRSGDLLKVKPYQDAEALVIEYIPGKGKYTGMLGALLVETHNGQRFKIGTGFSDKQRQNPPTIGATITYQYHGKTRNGIPRFASFLRIREIEK